ncbi:MAG: hypothetical protein KGL39_38170 [Patescibacteria group bacterium]|nr:hypothetical protein [Patescibacteria group bacterium]
MTGEPALAGVMEASRILGVRRDRVVREHAKGALPPAVGHLGCGRVWLRAELVAA